MKALVLLLAFLVLVPLGLGQFKETLSEDFEDETPGNMVDPSESWYTYSEVETQPATNNVTIDDDGLNGTTRSLEVSCASCTSASRAVARFAHDAIQPETAKFWIDIDNAGSPPKDANTISFQDEVGDTSVLISFSGTGVLNFNLLSCDGGSSQETFTTPNQPHQFIITWDWEAERYSLSIDGGAQFFGNKPFCQSVEEVSEFCVGASAADRSCGNSSGSGHFRFDEFEYLVPAVQPEPEPVPGPGNLFDDDGAFYGGNKSALADALQITEAALETGMGILLILVGAAIGFAVMKFMGAIFGAAVGLIFSLAFGLISLWVIAFILGLVVAFFFLRRNSNG